MLGKQIWRPRVTEEGHGVIAVIAFMRWEIVLFRSIGMRMTLSPPKTQQNNSIMSMVHDGLFVRG